MSGQQLHNGSSIDDLVAFIGAHKSLQEIQKDLVPPLKKLEKSNNTRQSSSSQSTTTTATSSSNLLEAQLADGSDPLALLHPYDASVGYLFILNARCGVNQPDLNVLNPFILTFVDHFDPEQLRLVPEQVVFFSKLITQIGVDLHDPSFSIQPLKKLLLRYPPPGTLTALHLTFLQTILNAREYEEARQVLEQDITDVEPSTYAIKYQDHLLYHYLGGIIMTLLRSYTRAIELFEICISAPGSGVSLIQIDAYKKLLLVQLLKTGTVEPLPSYTSNAVSSACKATTAYLEYAHAYANHDKKKLVAMHERHRETFEKDLNVGLIELTVMTFQRRTIQRLTATYITLSLAEIARMVELPSTEQGFREVEAQVRQMIADGEVHGSIGLPPNGDDWGAVTVTFTDDPEPYNSHATVSRVTKAIESAAQLDATIIERDWKLERNPDWVAKAFSSNASGQQTLGISSVDDDGMGDDDWAE